MTDNLFDRLKAPFPPDRVSWRVGPTMADKSRGLALCYIDARDVADRLDEVCGPANWQCRYPHADGKTVCEIGIRCEAEWIWKADGAGDSEMEAEKGALSDAFKRAAVRWGVGRYLYDVPGTWVDIEAKGKSYAIKASELARLAQTLRGPAPMAPPAPRGLDGAMSALASRLISDLRNARAVEGLEEWVVLEARRIETLDDANKARVRSAYAAHLRELKTRASLAA